MTSFSIGKFDTRQIKNVHLLIKSEKTRKYENNFRCISRRRTQKENLTGGGGKKIPPNEIFPYFVGFVWHKGVAPTPLNSFVSFARILYCRVNYVAFIASKTTILGWVRIQCIATNLYREYKKFFLLFFIVYKKNLILANLIRILNWVT